MTKGLIYIGLLKLAHLFLLFGRAYKYYLFNKKKKKDFISMFLPYLSVIPMHGTLYFVFSHIFCLSSYNRTFDLQKNNLFLGHRAVSVM